MSDPTEMKSIKCDEGFFYSAIPMGVRFGGIESEEQYQVKDSPAIFSSAMSYSFVPKSYSKLFFKKMLKGVKNIVEKNGIYYTACAERPGDIYFMFESRWVHVRGQDMVTDISPNQDMSECIINFLQSNLMFINNIPLLILSCF